MSDTTFAPVASPAPIPVGQILPWAIFGGLLMLIAIYFVGTEEGAMALFNGMYVHEFVHDGRHLLGDPWRAGDAHSERTARARRPDGAVGR